MSILGLFSRSIFTQNGLFPSRQHKEWFWPHDDSLVYGQLCWSNSSLVDFVTERVKDALRKAPTATIISVSQNDNSNYCKDPGDLAIIQEDGSPIGPLLR